MAKKPKDLPSLDADVTEVKDGVATTSFHNAFSNLTVSAQKEENTPVLVEKPKPKGGKPSKYSKEIAEIICQELSEGIPLREICRKDGFPAWRTIYDWMYKDPDLSAAIAHARDVGYDALAEQCLEIADNMQFGKTYSESTDKNGAVSKVVTTEDLLGHRKLQIETRLKLLAKFNPKKYGDAITHKGDSENPLEAGTTMLHQFILKLETKSATLNAQSSS